MCNLSISVTVTHVYLFCYCYFVDKERRKLGPLCNHSSCVKVSPLVHMSQFQNDLKCLSQLIWQH